MATLTMFVYLLPLGNREIVGYGMNGNPNYIDSVDFPAPAVRFRENTKEILALREKEKGDWKNLSLTEKKECKSCNVSYQGVVLN